MTAKRPAPLTLPPTLAAGDELLRYAADRDRLRPGNRLEPLIDGDAAFPAMLAAIAAARSFVHLEVYILSDDAVGQEFSAALRERAGAGVAVRLLCDGLGSFGLSEEFVAELREAGVEVLVFRPLRWGHWRRWTHRDHRKLLVCDGTVAFTGGLNLTLDNASRARGGGGWRDTAVRARGPVVSELERLFRDTWRQAGGAPYPPYPREADESLASADTQLAAALASGQGRRTQIRRWYLHAIRRARHSICIANAYFVPDRQLRRALCRAARRGVAVSVILPERSDVRLVQLASEHTYARLLRAGISVLLWPETHMHAKTAVIDGVWWAVGSYNLDYVSLFRSRDVVVVAVGDGRPMAAQFAADAARCRPLALSEWRTRPLWRRIASWLVYRIRRWL